MTMNPFAGVRGAKLFDQGEYLEPGEYVLQIDSMVWKKLNEGGNALIVETTILASDNERHPVGKKRSWFQKENTSFAGEALAFCIAACGYDRKDPADAAVVEGKVIPLSEDILLAALTKGTFKGRKVRCKVTHKITKEAKRDFNKHTFGPADTKLPF